MLEVPFNINMVRRQGGAVATHPVFSLSFSSVTLPPVQARDVMTEKPGAAMRVLYQLFVALNRNKVCMQQLAPGEGLR